MKYATLFASSFCLILTNAGAANTAVSNIACESATDCLTHQQATNTAATLTQRFNTDGKRAFVFSPRERKWAAYDNDGYLVAAGKANGGADHCHDTNEPCRTPLGTFYIERKGSPECVSSKYPIGVGGAPMPYCMFFHLGYAIHGSHYISNINGSHGCIRVQTAAAKWLSDNFIIKNTKVIVLAY